MQFAFRSLDYAHEVDSNVEAFHSQTGVYPALVGAYFDFTTTPENLAIFLSAVQAKGWAAGDTVLPAFGLGEFGTNRTDLNAKADWYRQSLFYLDGEDRIRFHFLYNGQNEAEDFSLRGLEGRLDGAYLQPMFRYRLFDPP